jgi:hypothetical protein
LPAKKLTFSNGKYTYPDTSVDIPFPIFVVGYWEDFDLKWEVSADASSSGQWIDAGTSTNYLYVTHKNPVINIIPPGHVEPINLQHTFLHIGCKNAKGFAVDNQIVDAIYNDEFTDRDVRRFDGDGPIQYWGPDNLSTPECWQPSQMLINLDGRCGGWAAFFYVILHIQGIDDASIVGVDWNNETLPDDYVSSLNSYIMSIFGGEHVNVYHLDKWLQHNTGHPPRSHFYVKKWNFTDMQNNFFIHKYYSIYVNFASSLTLLNGNTIEDRELDGIEAQGISNPRSEFENHAIIRYNGKFYDPSYGSEIKNTSSDWQVNSIDGSGGMVRYFRLNPLGEVESYFINWLGQPTNLDFNP